MLPANEGERNEDDRPGNRRRALADQLRCSLGLIFIWSITRLTPGTLFATFMIDARCISYWIVPESVTSPRLMLALKLFEEHRLSLGKASELAGFTKAAFMEVAGKHGVAVFDYPAGDLEREMSL